MTEAKKNNTPKNSHLAEVLALDWIPVLFDDNKLPLQELPSNVRINEIKSQLDEAEQEALKDISVFCQNIFNDEEKRRSEIDSRASMLIGITGIAAGFITGFAPASLNNAPYPTALRAVIIILYVLIGSSFLITILISRRAIQMGKYEYSQPDPSDVLSLREWSQQFFYRNLAAKLLYSFERNVVLNNRKATYVIGAQDWFRNAIVLMLMLLACLALAPVFIHSQPTEPIPVIIITPTATITPRPTSTNTPVSPSPTPISFNIPELLPRTYQIPPIPVSDPIPPYHHKICELGKNGQPAVSTQTLSLVTPALSCKRKC